jgi:hypothetical protein
MWHTFGQERDVPSWIFDSASVLAAVDVFARYI